MFPAIELHTAPVQASSNTAKLFDVHMEFPPLIRPLFIKHKEAADNVSFNKNEGAVKEI